MKLVVKRAPFAAGLTLAASVVPRQTIRPILRHALLAAAADGSVEIQATDMELGLRYAMKAESVSEAATLCLPGAILAGLLGECAEEVVTLDTEGAKAVLKIGRDQFEIFGQEASEFPGIPAFPSGPVTKIPAGELRTVVDRTLFASAHEPGRRAINGLYLQVKERVLESVATDGRRLAYCKTKLKSTGALEEGVIVPVKTMQEVRKLCELVGDSEEISVATHERQILFRGGPLTLCSVLVEGIFPKYQQVIPKDCDKEITLKREVFQQALRKASYLASEETHSVVLTFTPGTCLVETQSAEKGQAKVTVEAEYAGAEMRVAFNAQYVADCLKVLAQDTFRLALREPARPGVIREGADYQYVLMPVTSGQER
jgi:DNA polymerase-3 subunit beta